MLNYYKKLFMIGVKSEFANAEKPERIVSTLPEEEENTEDFYKEVNNLLKISRENKEINDWVETNLSAGKYIEGKKEVQYPVFLKESNIPWHIDLKIWNNIMDQNIILLKVKISDAQQAVDWWYKNFSNILEEWWKDKKIIYGTAKRQLAQIRKQTSNLNIQNSNKIEFNNINNNIKRTTVTIKELRTKRFTIENINNFDFTSLQSLVIAIQSNKNPDTKFLKNKEELFKEIDNLLAKYDYIKRGRKKNIQESKSLEDFRLFYVKTKATIEKDKNIIYLNKTKEELIQELNEINQDIEWGKDRKQDKRVLIDYISRKFKKEGYIVYSEKWNINFKVKDLKTWKEVTGLNLEQSDLQSIAILSSETQDDINKWRFEKNIPDNIVQSVIDKFGLVNPKTKKPWNPNDFRWDSPATIAKAEKNKTEFFKQLNETITELEGKNTNSQIQSNSEQFENNTIWLQKLYLTKSYVWNEARVSNKAISFVQSFVDNRQELLSKIENPLKNWELKHLLMSEIPIAILAWIAMWIASKILPKDWMKNWAYTFILWLLWLDAYQKYANSGLSNKIWSKFFQKNPAWHNPPEKKHTWPIDTYLMKRNIKEAFTDEPDWIRADHKLKYAKMITANKEKQLFDRDKFDKLFMFLSNDPTFLSKEKTDLDWIDENNYEDKIKNLLTPDTLTRLEKNWIDKNDIWSFIELLQWHPQEQDKTVADMFVDDRWEEAWLKDEEKKYIAGQTEFNREIFDLVNQLPWQPIWSEYLINKNNSLKARVQEAINLSSESSTYWIPFAPEKANPENIQNTIEALENINNPTNSTITKIIEKYKNVLKVVESKTKREDFVTDAYLTNELWIVWIWTRAINKTSKQLNNVLVWMSWNPKLAVIPKVEEVKIEEIDKYIAKWKEILSLIEEDKITPLEDRLKEEQNIKAIIAQLRQRKIEILEKDKTGDKTKEIQVVIIDQINDNPDNFVEQTEKALEEMENLTTPFNSYDDYIQALLENEDNIKSLTLIAGIDESSVIDNKAKEVLIKAKNIISNKLKFKTNIEKVIQNDLNNLSIIDYTNVIWLKDLYDKKQEFEKIKDKVFVNSALTGVTNLLNKIIDNIQASRKENKILIIQWYYKELFWVNDSFGWLEELNKKITELESWFKEKEDELINSLKVPEYNNDENKFINSIKKFQENNLKYLSWEKKEKFKESIDAQIEKLEKSYIDKLKAETDIAKIWIIYDKWTEIAEDLDYKKSDDFEEAYKTRLEDFAKKELEKKMKEKVAENPEILKIYEEFIETEFYKNKVSKWNLSPLFTEERIKNNSIKTFIDKLKKVNLHTDYKDNNIVPWILIKIETKMTSEWLFDDIKWAIKYYEVLWIWKIKEIYKELLNKKLLNKK